MLCWWSPVLPEDPLFQYWVAQTAAGQAVKSFALLILCQPPPLGTGVIGNCLPPYNSSRCTKDSCCSLCLVFPLICSSYKIVYEKILVFSVLCISLFFWSVLLYTSCFPCLYISQPWTPQKLSHCSTWSWLLGPSCAQHSEIRIVSWKVRVLSESGSTVHRCVTAVRDRNGIWIFFLLRDQRGEGLISLLSICL